ncbi:unnamed protein product [Cylicocyclus nassatus]|uniref:Uncharacterized protein n=1 Tax=Cylicocyclus nassatus TaxID=53992 RepID=A0AA36DV79_CYLNA|nr:unnamed protein product [Cylicocyclus nassatus]
MLATVLAVRSEVNMFDIVSILATRGAGQNRPSSTNGVDTIAYSSAAFTSKVSDNPDTLDLSKETKPFWTGADFANSTPSKGGEGQSRRSSRYASESTEELITKLRIHAQALSTIISERATLFELSQENEIKHADLWSKFTSLLFCGYKWSFDEYSRMYLLNWKLDQLFTFVKMAYDRALGISQLVLSMHSPTNSLFHELCADHDAFCKQDVFSKTSASQDEQVLSVKTTNMEADITDDQLSTGDTASRKAFDELFADLKDDCNQTFHMENVTDVSF